jgi:RimJ/RimL family protein N-acetyltransferase
MRDLPELDTARLTLRAHTVADFDESAAMWGDPAVLRYLAERPFTHEEVWARLLRYAGLWPLLGYGYFVARERGTGRFVGEVGLADFHRDITPSLGSAPEAGWVLASWAHGQGFATEAMEAVLAWHDTTAAPSGAASGRTVCIIRPDNASSVRVAAKCGYTGMGRGLYKGQELLVFERGHA